MKIRRLGRRGEKRGVLYCAALRRPALQRYHVMCTYISTPGGHRGAVNHMLAGWVNALPESEPG